MAERPNIAKRFLNQVPVGATFLPDALVNAVPSAGYSVGKAILNDSDYPEPDLPDYSELGIPKDVFENTLRQIGVIRNYPAPETTGEKIADNLGNATGSLLLPGGWGAKAEGTVGKFLAKNLLGTNAPLTSLKQLANPMAAATATGTAAQAAGQPFVEDAFPDNPMAQMLMNIGVGVGGAYLGAGGTQLMPKSFNQPIDMAEILQRAKNAPKTEFFPDPALQPNQGDRIVKTQINKNLYNPEDIFSGKVNPQFCDSRFGDCGTAAIKNTYKLFDVPRRLNIGDFVQDETAGIMLDKTSLKPLDTPGVVNTADPSVMHKKLGIKEDLPYFESNWGQMKADAPYEDKKAFSSLLLNESVDKGQPIYINKIDNDGAHAYIVSGKVSGDHFPDKKPRYMAINRIEDNPGISQGYDRGSSNISFITEADLVRDLESGDYNGFKTEFTKFGGIDIPASEARSSTVPVGFGSKELLQKYFDKKQFQQQTLDSLGPVSNLIRQMVTGGIGIDKDMDYSE